MRLKNLLVLLIMVCTLVSCSDKDSEITLDFEGPQPVLYSFLNPDSIVSVQLAWTTAPQDGALAPIEDASITLFEDNQNIGILNHEGLGTYFFLPSHLPKIGQEYRLEVSIPGYANTLRTDNERIPARPELSSIVIEEGLSLPTISSNYNARITLQPSWHAEEGKRYAWFISDPEQGDDRYTWQIDDAQDCLPGVYGLQYNGYVGKNFLCLEDPSELWLNGHVARYMQEPYLRQFIWATFNESSDQFFRSQGTEDALNITEIFFQPTALVSNVEHAYGLFTAYATTSYEISY